MKKTILLLCALLVLQLAACDKAPENGTASTAPSDSLQSNLHPEDKIVRGFGAGGFVETSEGYYYGLDVRFVGTEIYFCPRGEDTFYPLCGKPNCKHNDENCNAFCGDCFGYYDGALYSLGFDSNDSDKINVYRINLDGTDHKLIKTIDVSEQYPSGGAFDYAFHHGKLFVLCQPNLDVPEPEREEHLIVVDLSDLSQSEPAVEFLQKANFPQPGSVWFYQDKLFGVGRGDKSMEFSPTARKLIEIDAKTGASSIPVPGFVTGLCATDDTLYFFQPDLEMRYPGCGESDPGFREYDVKTGTVKECGMPVENVVSAQYDENYIYAYFNPSLLQEEHDVSPKETKTYILSRDYKLVDTLELNNYEYIFAITSDRIFFGSKEDNDLRIQYYLDKSEIGSHHLELKPVKTVG